MNPFYVPIHCRNVFVGIVVGFSIVLAYISLICDSLSVCLQSLMSTTAFGLGSKYFALYEVAGVGIQWRTLNQSPVEGDDFNLLLSMVMLTIDAIVYGVLTWYIEAVHPGKLQCCYYCAVQTLPTFLLFSNNFTVFGFGFLNVFFSSRDVRTTPAMVFSLAEILLVR